MSSNLLYILKRSEVRSVWFEKKHSIYGDALLKNVRSMLLDVSWEVRDTALEFLSSLFQFYSIVKILLDNEIPNLIIDRLRDNESFVRGTALRSLLVTIMKS